MKVCMISTYPPRRCGVGDYTSDLAIALIKKDISIDVLTYNAPDHPKLEKITENLKVHRSLNKQITGLGLWKRIKALSPDIIHLQSTSFLHRGLFNLFVFFKDDTPLITTVHDAPSSHRQFHTTPFLRPVYKKSEKLIVHSNEIKNRLVNFHGICKEKIIKMPHGVDIERFNPHVSTADFENKYELEDKFVILFFGFLRPGKGVEYLINAFKEVKKIIPNAALLIAGGTPGDSKRYSLGMKSETNYPNRLKKMIQEIEVEKDVIFTGYLPDRETSSCLTSADIAVFPYTGASQSGPLHKAFASGCVVVASDVGGISEVVADRKTGLLVPLKNSEALVEAILRLYNDSDLRNMLGKNAREKAEKELSWAGVGSMTIDAYNSLLER